MKIRVGLHYGIVFLISLVGIVVFFSIPPEYTWRRFLAGVVTAVVYALWGILHHAEDHTLNRKIVLEYGALAVFASALLWVFLLT